MNIVLLKHGAKYTSDDVNKQAKSLKNIQIMTFFALLRIQKPL